MNPEGEQFKVSAAAFHGEDYQSPVVNAAQPKPEVNTNTGLYKKDARQFYGADKAETESQGSCFQKNAAVFMDTNMPGPGERPFKIDRNAKGEDFKRIKGTSLLNEERLREHERNMERDPIFKKNMKRFYCLPSHATNSQGPRSTAQKLDAFVQ